MVNERDGPSVAAATEFQSGGGDVEDPTATYYVDYTPPDEARVLPPAKYKLALLVDILVVLAIFETWILQPVMGMEGGTSMKRLVILRVLRLCRFVRMLRFALRNN